MTAETLKCDAIRDLLAAASPTERALDASQQRHLASCLRCQAEQAQYRRMLNAMRSLRDVGFPEPLWMEASIRRHIDSQAPSRWRGSPQMAAVLGGVAAGAAATAGLLAVAARRRGVRFA